MGVGGLWGERPPKCGFSCRQLPLVEEPQASELDFFSSGKEQMFQRFVTQELHLQCPVHFMGLKP